MNTTLNIAMIVAFTFLGGWMFVRYFHTRDKLIVQDKTWNFMRISFGMIEVLAVASLLAGGNSILDYIRIAVMVLACTAYMIVRDGLGEEGLVHNGKVTPWKPQFRGRLSESNRRTEQNSALISALTTLTENNRRNAS